MDENGSFVEAHQMAVSDQSPPRDATDNLPVSSSPDQPGCFNRNGANGIDFP
jgi:hypothetical protein